MNSTLPHSAQLRRAMLFAGTLGAVALFGVHACPAVGYVGYATMTPTEQANVDVITQWSYQNSPQAATGQGEACSAVCSNLRSAESTLDTGSPTATTLVPSVESQAYNVAADSGLTPAIAGGGTDINGALLTVPEAGVVAGASAITFYAGWKIGTGIRSLFVHPKKVVQWDYDYGDPPSTWVMQHHSYAQYGYNPSVTTGPGWFLGPTSGVNTGYAPQFSGLDATTNCSSGFAPLGPITEGSTALCFDKSGNCCADVTQGVIRVGFELGEAPGYSDEGDTTQTLTAPSDPGYTTAKNALTDALNSGKYPELNNWLDYQLGAPNACDPTDPQVCNLTEQDDDRCRPSDGGAPTNSDPGPGYDFPWTQRYTPAPGTNSFLTSNGDSVPLYWGTIQPTANDPLNGFGYRHILAKHGWAAGDIRDTETALLQPGTDIAADANQPWQEREKYTWDYPGQGVQCRRTVIVDRGQAPDEQRAGVGPAGIITSYAGVA